MIKLAKSFRNKMSTVILFFDDSKSKELDLILPDEYVALVNDYKKAKKIKENTIKSIQLDSSSSSNYLLLINLGKVSDFTSKRLRSLSASAIRSLPEDAQAQWTAVKGVEDWEWHVSQVIAMVQYTVPHSKPNQNLKNTHLIRLYQV